MSLIINTPELKPIWAILAGILGLSFGSFANVLIYRLPRKEKITRPPSHCPHCKSLIKPYDNIPLFSFILLKGKCRHCYKSISPQYPLVEALMGGMFVGLIFKFGLDWEALFYALFLFLILTHMVIDFQHYLLLDCLNLVGILGGVLGLLCIPDLNLNAGLMGAGLGGGLLLSIYLIILLLFRKKGMGLGDIKTAIMCGLYLNPINIILVFLIASFIGVIWGIVRIFLGKGRTMPFGTLMGISSIIMVFWGEKIIGWIYR